MMKRSTLYLLSLLVLSLFGATAMAQGLQQDDSKKAAIEFVESEHDFGTSARVTDRSPTSSPLRMSAMRPSSSPV